MSDLIDRRKLIKNIERMYKADWNFIKRTMNMAKVIEDAPSVDHVCQLCDCYDKQSCYCNLLSIHAESDFYCREWVPEGAEEGADD